jgi:hypothetical protein
MAAQGSPADTTNMNVNQSFRGCPVSEEDLDNVIYGCQKALTLFRRRPHRRRNSLNVGSIAATSPPRLTTPEHFLDCEIFAKIQGEDGLL